MVPPAAAANLPLGLADKLFLSLSDADEFDKDARLFGRSDRSGTATYHLRPFGRPLIEVYFGGRLAAELEAIRCRITVRPGREEPHRVESIALRQITEQGAS